MKESLKVNALKNISPVKLWGNQMRLLQWLCDDDEQEYLSRLEVLDGQKVFIKMAWFLFAIKMWEGNIFNKRGPEGKTLLMILSRICIPHIICTMIYNKWHQVYHKCYFQKWEHFIHKTELMVNGLPCVFLDERYG